MKRIIALLMIASLGTHGAHALGLSSSLPPFKGEVVQLKNGENFLDLNSDGLQGMIFKIEVPGCAASGDCSYSFVMARVANANGKAATDWEIVPPAPVNFPGNESFAHVFDGVALMDYPHMYEDYYTSVVYAREPRAGGFVLTLYIAKREIGQIAPVPRPVDFVKYELAAGSLGNPGVHWHLKPVAMARSVGRYTNAEQALICEVGLHPPGSTDSCERPQ